MNKNLTDGLVVVGVAIFLYIMYRTATKKEETTPDKSNE